MAETVQPETHNEEEGLKIAHEKIKIWKENPPQTNLSLKGLKLTRIPSEVFELKELQLLSIGMNPITDIPDEFKNLQKLRNFNANRCAFSKFPTALIKIPSLELINLNNNQIELIPEEIDILSKLKTFTITGNKLSKLPNSITKLISLVNLDLSGNRLTALPEDMADLINLRSILLSRNPIELFEGNKKVNLSGKNSVVPVLRYFMTLSRNDSEKSDQQKFYSHIEFTKEVKTAFYQYLVYFNSFIEKTKGKNFNIQIFEDENGLTISGNINDRAYIQQYLIEFIGYIKDKVDLINPFFEKEVSSNEKELVMIELRNQVRHMTSQLELKNLETKMLNGEVSRLMQIIELEKRNPQPILIQSLASSTSSAIAESKMDFKVELPDLQDRFFELKNELYEYLSQVQRNELDTIDNELIGIEEQSDKEAISKTPFKRIKRIFEQLNNPESDWSKALSATKRGLDLLQSLGRKYNKIAPWISMPSIPELFVGKEK